MEERYVSPYRKPKGLERELLDILVEECGEIVQAAAKCLRFGPEDGYPGTLRSNRRDLSHEFGDLLAVVERLKGHGYFDEREVEAGRLHKHDRLRIYLQSEQSAWGSVAAPARTSNLSPSRVEWVVNDLGELGVKIGDQFFFLYKGESLVYDGLHEDGTLMKWRPVGKREFGECCHPINHDDPHLFGTVSTEDGEEWKPLPLVPYQQEGSAAAPSTIEE